MVITEIRIKLMESSEDRLRAFCSITIDDAFVVRDLKIIDGTTGSFVAMPSRKLTSHCRHCHHKNHLRATYCNHCGGKVQGDGGYDSPQKLYADVAHPINSECREMIQNAVIEEFEAELRRCEQPGYRSRYDDGIDDDFCDADVMPDSKQRTEFRVDPKAAESTPKPHFDRTAREVANDKDDSDGFGAGIFS
jgi:stage V sporulation protein G